MRYPSLNPAWFLPAAGNIIVPIMGVEFVSKDVCWFFFSIGIFFWLVLFIIIFYRIMFPSEAGGKAHSDIVYHDRPARPLASSHT